VFRLRCYWFVEIIWVERMMKGMPCRGLVANILMVPPTNPAVGGGNGEIVRRRKGYTPSVRSDLRKVKSRHGFVSACRRCRRWGCSVLVERNDC